MGDGGDSQPSPAPGTLLAMTADASFDELVRRAAGKQPYDYQRRLASEGLPELLTVPTGAGKTLGAVLPWLYRRRFHPDAAVRRGTPHWLVYALPMRVLVEQTIRAIEDWVEALGLSGSVGVHRVMGGEGRLESAWRMHPEQDAIFVGTIDLLLSRALNRGYLENRFAWPIDFGLFNSGCQWVFDEVQLMGPALPTSLQIEGIRRALGTALPCTSMWMSATVERRWLATVDHPSISTTVELAAADRAGELLRRLEATKAVRRLELDGDSKRRARTLAELLAGHHRSGTLTIAVLNTVDRARELREALDRITEAEIVLLHSRFRPADRAARTDEALASVDPNGPGRIVVSTQVLEAGVDISAATLFTEAAPWPSIVQRAGRCNREGAIADATLLWAPPPTALPYEETDVEVAVAELSRLEGTEVTPGALADRTVPTSEPVHPVLRRRDVVQLFDTAPDLSGNDLDVSRFIREREDLDVHLAWRAVTEAGPAMDDRVPTRDELCPVTVGATRKALKGDSRRAWRYDHVAERWVGVRAADVRPGQALLLRSAEGGYDPLTGWNPSASGVVPPIEADDASPIAGAEEATGADPLSTTGQWLGLRQHLEEVEIAVRELMEGLAPLHLTPAQLEAAAVAGRLHDVGKVHPEFQAMLAGTVRSDEERVRSEASPPPWAKGGSGRGRHQRPHFRHELASLLALLGGASSALEGVTERDLALYLIAAHHGRVRLAIRSLPDEVRPGDPAARVALGIRDGDALPEVDVPGGRLPATTLDLGPMGLGDDMRGDPSWSCRALTLRDRPDLGPYRLAFLEAVVRLADWRASANGLRG